MRVEGDMFYVASYDDGFELRGSRDDLLEAVADEVKDMDELLSDDFFMCSVTLGVEDGDLHVRAEEVSVKKLVTHLAQKISGDEG
ncbi:hypothetical protein AKJ61_03395 [candidate division MSBL1 archaeon SCGC-AAA259B11]|uniref:Uncharacterized protein n=1 Tax=candidate division MSBL1 archaeon SCGC-AAA259B11 TaxID=1698260 RepID=A0A133U4W4_9EURY|nr:hypothetical protein AKJ61_03395 [candidate division MSBL1 archaeon SCGC-AAA259B11]